MFLKVALSCENACTETCLQDIIKLITIYSLYTGSANENFAEFAVECLENFVISISTIIHHLQANNPVGEAGSIMLYI